MGSGKGYPAAAEERKRRLEGTAVWWGVSASRPAVDELAAALGVALGWDDARRAEELQRALGILAEKHGVRI